MIIPDLIEPPWFNHPKTKRVPMPVLLLDIPADGIVKFDLDVPAEAVSVDLQVCDVRVLKQLKLSI